ncbi:MAG: LytTR family DNA-binding domain-containing protein, partial [Lachnospiraceae bacterium]|nr:LytTR family DNA-binding domain-containing protein [Lachnospiraceae bacterium]
NEEIWKQLDENSFAHIHVSFIVNLLHVKSIEKDEAILDNGERLLIARTQKQALKDKHMQFLKGMV